MLPYLADLWRNMKNKQEIEEQALAGNMFAVNLVVQDLRKYREAVYEYFNASNPDTSDDEDLLVLENAIKQIEQLPKLEHGDPLKVGELDNLKDGSFVWATYEEKGRLVTSINGIYKISRKPDGSVWELSNDLDPELYFSPIGRWNEHAQMFHAPLDTDDCVDEPGGCGIMRLFKVKE